MQYKLHLLYKDLVILHDHAEASLPTEAAALIFGQVTHQSILANHIRLVDNESLSSTTSFMVDPEEQYQLLTEAETLGEELVCIFHSHPAPPFPSRRDQENMKLNPVAWLIASKESGTWVSKAFIMEDDQIQELDLFLS
jgi:proteasome lid subunit RPN8/RPN11